MDQSKPNIIIITTDQQRTDTLGCYGSDFTHTPGLDRLAAKGIRCDRAYTVNPVCTPARFSIITGQYVSRHGAWNVGTTCPETIKTLGDYLGEGGYKTHLIGKAHFQAYSCPENESIEAFNHEKENMPPRWNGPYYGYQSVELSMGHASYGQHGHYGKWVRSRLKGRDFNALNDMSSPCATTFPGEAVDWEWPMELHSSKWIADRSIDFLEKQDGEKPFLLSIGFQDPHHPHCVPRDYGGKINPKDVPLPKRREGELEDKPEHFLLASRGNLSRLARENGEYRIAGQGGFADTWNLSENDIRLGRAYYYSTVKIIDYHLSRVLDTLDEKKMSHNTLVIFTTDHGELLGDHGLWQKGPYHYEELVKIPFIARWPGVIPAGDSTKALINQTDILPTLLSAAGCPLPAEIDGHNILPLLCNKAEPVRSHTIVECVDNPGKLRLKTIITENRKLTYYHDRDFGELYDLSKDPGEFVNLWNAREYEKEKTKLISLILDHMERLEPRCTRYAYA